MDVDLLNLTSASQMDLTNIMTHLERLAAEYGPEQSPPPPPPPSASSVAFPSGPFCSPTTPIALGTTAAQDNNYSLNISKNYSTADLSSALDSSSLQHCHNRASVSAMREMIFRFAAMQPIHIDPEAVKPPKRRNVRISKDPQSVAARRRRERISERIRILQRLVPGGTKMDTASMLDEAVHYVKFLKTQVQSLERAAAANSTGGLMSNGNYSWFQRVYELPAEQGHMNQAYTNVELS